MRTLFALRAIVGIPWVISWNLGLVAAWAMDGFRGSPESAPAVWLMAVTMFATALLWGAIWSSSGVRALAFAPTRMHGVEDRGIRLSTVVPLVLAIAVLNEHYAWWS